MNRSLRYLRHLNAIVASGLTGFYVYVKFDRFETCKKMLESRKDDPTLLLTPHLKILVNEVMDDMRLKEKERSKIKAFLSEIPDFQHHGSVYDSYGALLEIPQYLILNENVNVKMVDKELNPIKGSQSFGNVLHISDEAKKFAIARELYELVYLDNPILYILPLLLNLNFLILSYFTEKFFKVKSLLKLHSIFFLMGVFGYAVAFDTITIYTEAEADFHASDLGKSYVEGGIEFYRKMIQKNRALKKANENAPYSKDGDVNYSVFGKHHLSLYKRLSYLKEIQNSKNYVKPSLWDYVLTAKF